MKIVLPGGSGQVGQMLARAWSATGHDVTVLSRRPAPAPWRVEPWDGATLGPWTRWLDGADVVVNLAGRSVNCRYHAQNRREILESRVQSTRAVGQAIAAARRPPRVWLQASTATIYAHRYDAPQDEATGTLGGSEPDSPETWKFSIDVATAWERMALENAPAGTRLVLLRSAMTMSSDQGGVFDTLYWLVRLGLGGTIGDGRQFVSWVHERDFVRALDWLIAHDDLAGAVNIAAPQPLPQAEFMGALRQAAGVRVGLPATKWMVELGAWAMGTESELVLKSRRVTPARLLSSRFEFAFPAWPEAAADLCQRRERGTAPRTSTEETRMKLAGVVDPFA